MYWEKTVCLYRISLGESAYVVQFFIFSFFTML